MKARRTSVHMGAMDIIAFLLGAALGACFISCLLLMAWHWTTRVSGPAAPNPADA